MSVIKKEPAGNQIRKGPVPAGFVVIELKNFAAAYHLFCKYMVTYSLKVYNNNLKFHKVYSVELQYKLDREKKEREKKVEGQSLHRV